MPCISECFLSRPIFLTILDMQFRLNNPNKIQREDERVKEAEKHDNGHWVGGRETDGERATETLAHLFHLYSIHQMVHRCCTLSPDSSRCMCSQFTTGAFHASRDPLDTPCQPVRLGLQYVSVFWHDMKAGLFALARPCDFAASALSSLAQWFSFYLLLFSMPPLSIVVSNWV